MLLLSDNDQLSSSEWTQSLWDTENIGWAYCQKWGQSYPCTFIFEAKSSLRENFQTETNLGKLNGESGEALHNHAPSMWGKWTMNPPSYHKPPTPGPKWGAQSKSWVFKAMHPQKLQYGACCPNRGLAHTPTPDPGGAGHGPPQKHPGGPDATPSPQEQTSKFSPPHPFCTVLCLPCVVRSVCATWSATCGN